MNIEEKIYDEIQLNPTLINIGYGKYLQRKYKDDEVKKNIINELTDVFRYIDSFIDSSKKIYVHDMRRTQRNKIINSILMTLGNIIYKFRMKNYNIKKRIDNIYKRGLKK